MPLLLPLFLLLHFCFCISASAFPSKTPQICHPERSAAQPKNLRLHSQLLLQLTLAALIYDAFP
jgi:hypothetical protein